MPVFIRLAGPARRMTIGTKRGGVRMSLHGLPGPNARLTPFYEGSYNLLAPLNFLSLSALLTAGDLTLGRVWHYVGGDG